MRLHNLGDSALLTAGDSPIQPTVPARNPVRLDGAPSGPSPASLLLLAVAVGLAWALSSNAPPPRGSTLRG